MSSMLSSTSSLSSRIGFLTGLSLSCLHSKIIFSLFLNGKIIFSLFFSMVRKDFPLFFNGKIRFSLFFFQWQDKDFPCFSPKIERFLKDFL